MVEKNAFQLMSIFGHYNKVSKAIRAPLCLGSSVDFASQKYNGTKKFPRGNFYQATSFSHHYPFFAWICFIYTSYIFNFA